MNHVTILAGTVIVDVKMAISVKCVTSVSNEFYVSWVTIPRSMVVGFYKIYNKKNKKILKYSNTLDNG